MNKFWKKEIISIDDLRAILALTKTSLPLQECLKLLKNKDNSLVFDKVMQNLKNGKQSSELISPYLESKIKNSFSAFIKILSFEKALELTINLYDFENKRSRKLRKDLFYPLSLFFFSLIGIYLFDIYGLDSIFAILKSFKIDVEVFKIGRYIMRLFSYLSFVLISLFLITITFFKRTNNIVLAYIFANKYLHNSILETYYSQHFIALFSLCSELGYKTKDSLMIIKNMHEKPIVAFIASRVDQDFLKGQDAFEALNNNYLDPRVSAFIKVASASLNFEEALKRYVKVVDLELERKINFYSKTVQMTIYCLIGVLIIFIYQVLFLPMQSIAYL